MAMDDAKNPQTNRMRTQNIVYNSGAVAVHDISAQSKLFIALLFLILFLACASFLSDSVRAFVRLKCNI